MILSLSLSLSPLAKMYYQNSSGASNDFLPLPSPSPSPAVSAAASNACRLPTRPCSISVKISGENYSPTLPFFSFHSVRSCAKRGPRLRDSVFAFTEPGADSFARLRTSFPSSLSPIQIDLQAFSSSSPALRTTLKSTCELRSLISLHKRLAPFFASCLAASYNHA